MYLRAPMMGILRLISGYHIQFPMCTPLPPSDAVKENLF